MDKGNKKNSRLALAVIAVSLAASFGIIASPPEVQVWILALAGALVAIAAALKFTAISMLSFRGSRRLLGILWGLLAFFFLLLLIVDGQHIVALLE